MGNLGSGYRIIMYLFAGGWSNETVEDSALEFEHCTRWLAVSPLWR